MRWNVYIPFDLTFHCCCCWKADWALRQKSRTKCRMKRRLRRWRNRRTVGRPRSRCCRCPRVELILAGQSVAIAATHEVGRVFHFETEIKTFFATCFFFFKKSSKLFSQLVFSKSLSKHFFRKLWLSNYCILYWVSLFTFNSQVCYHKLSV